MIGLAVLGLTIGSTLLFTTPLAAAPARPKMGTSPKPRPKPGLKPRPNSNPKPPRPAPPPPAPLPPLPRESGVLLSHERVVETDVTRVRFTFSGRPVVRIPKPAGGIAFSASVDGRLRADVVGIETRDDPILSGYAAGPDENGNLRLYVQSRVRTLGEVTRSKGARPGTEDVVFSLYHPTESLDAVNARLAALRRARARGMRVVLVDAGHGGKDPGTSPVIGRPPYEKDLALDIARRLAAELARSRKVTPVLLRDDDRFLSLSRRVFMTNFYGADLFVSVHLNASTSPRVRGFEVYVLSENGVGDAGAEAVANRENESMPGALPIGASVDDLRVAQILTDLTANETVKESVLLASAIRDKVLRAKLLAGPPIKRENFHVLRNLAAPSVLIETGYLTSKDDRKILLAETGRAALARSIAAGILAFDAELGPLSTSTK